MNKESFFSWKRLLPTMGVLLALGAIIALLATGKPLSSHAAPSITTITPTPTPGHTASPPILYEIRTDSSIWQYTGTPLTGWKEIDNSQKANQIAVSVTGELYKEYQSDGSVWKYTGTPLTGWVQIAN